MNYKKLVGEKVYLSPVCPDDWEIFEKWNTDYEMQHLYGGGDGVHPPAIDASGAESQSRNKNKFVIVCKETNKVIGNCGFNVDDVANRYWRKGILV